MSGILATERSPEMENNNTATQNPDTQQTAAQSNQQSTPALKL